MEHTLTIDAGLLTQEVAWVAKTSRARRGTAALSAVRVAALVGGLQLRRTDYDLFAESVLPAQGGGQASILVDPAKLVSVLKGASGPAVIDVTATELTVTAAGRSVKLRASADVDDYPEWPVFIAGDTGAAIVTASQLGRVLTSVGDDDTLPMLTAVRFDDGVMVTTDRFRLTCVSYTTHGKPMAALVPSAVLRGFTRGNDLVTIDHGKMGTDGVEGGVVHVSSGRRSIIGRVLDADFPSWRQLIPDAEAATVNAVIRRDDLVAAIGAGDNVTLTICAADGEGPATIKVIGTDRAGDIEVEQQLSLIKLVRGDALPFTVRLSSKNLKECLKSLASGVVQLQATTALTPLALRGLGDNDLHLVMPIRIAS